MAAIFAFTEAGIFALLSIAILLWIVLRRLGDVLLTLVPLLLAGLITLEAVAHAIRAKFAGAVADNNVAAATEAHDIVRQELEGLSHA